MRKTPDQSVDVMLADYDAAAARLGPEAAVNDMADRLESGPRSSAPWSALARRLLQQGQPSAAAVLLDRARRLLPDEPELIYLRGNALRMSGKPAEAERDLREALRVDPRHRDASWSLAYMLREQGRHGAAADVMCAFARMHADDSDHVLAALDFLRQGAAHAAAREIARAARARWPQHARIAAAAGEIELALGNFSAARPDLLCAIDQAPELGACWLRLSRCQHYREGADSGLSRTDVSRFAAAAHNQSLSRMTRACAGFALGKAFDDLGRFDDAAAALRAGNALAAEDAPWNPLDWQRFIERQCAATAPLGAVSDSDFSPLFIVGLPRSGTTLLAANLAHYANLRDRGELNWVPEIHAALAASGRLRDRHALSQAAALIAAQMRSDDAPARWYVDKNPLNFRYVAFMRALFPRARFLHCRRGLRDTALSIWMQHFAHPDLAFSYRFDAIAAFIGGYRQLIECSRKLLAGASLEVRYEALVADPLGEKKRVAEFLGLREDERQSGGAPAAIATASVWQARQPIHQSSVGRWKNYRTCVPELERLFPE